MEIGVSGSIFINKNIKIYVGQGYPYSMRWQQNIVAIIHIYGARDIFLLFYNNQDTEYEY